MRRMPLFAKFKKGFTLIELIAVMAIMVIATAIVLPNIRGIVSKTEESKYKAYCVEAATYVRSHTNLLGLGEDKIAYEDKKSGDIKYYTITTPDGLASALNEYNLESAYQYYVLAFESSSATKDPTSTVKDLITKNKLEKKDVMITVITTKESGRVPTYTLQGFWYYSYEKEQIVLYYYAPSKQYGTGYRKLTKDGK